MPKDKRKPAGKEGEMPGASLLAAFHAKLERVKLITKLRNTLMKSPPLRSEMEIGYLMKVRCRCCVPVMMSVFVRRVRDTVKSLEYLLATWAAMHSNLVAVTTSGPPKPGGNNGGPLRENCAFVPELPPQYVYDCIELWLQRGSEK